VRLLDPHTLAGADVYAKNTLAEKERAGLRRNESVDIDDGVTSVILPPVSWTVLSFV
jgi:alpha-N-arabinofuranosidase